MHPRHLLSPSSTPMISIQPAYRDGCDPIRIRSATASVLSRTTTGGASSQISTAEGPSRSLPASETPCTYRTKLASPTITTPSVEPELVNARFRQRTGPRPRSCGSGPTVRAPEGGRSPIAVVTVSVRDVGPLVEGPVCVGRSESCPSFGRARLYTKQTAIFHIERWWEEASSGLEGRSGSSYRRRLGRPLSVELR